MFTIFPEFVSLSFELLKPRSRLRRESDCYVNTGTQYTHTHTVIIYNHIPSGKVASVKKRKRGEKRKKKTRRNETHKKTTRKRV